MAISANGDPTTDWHLEIAATEDGTEKVLTARYSNLEWIVSESATTPSSDLYGHLIHVDENHGFTLKNGERLWSRAARDPQRPVVVRT